MSRKLKPSKSSAKEPEGVMATSEDFQNLIKSNPSLELPLVNIIQKRLLSEKDAEIKHLKSLIPAEK